MAHIGIERDVQIIHRSGRQTGREATYRKAKVKMKRRETGLGRDDL